MPIYLTGLPGSGKTSMGRKLAEMLNQPFFDLDDEIEAATGSKIAELFERGGERSFREAERNCLQRFLKPGDFILATGGGTPCFFDNMNQMLASGTVVFLNPPQEEILRRLNPEEADRRPLFASSESIAEKLQHLLNERMSYYQRAQIIWTGGDVAELAALIRS